MRLSPVNGSPSGGMVSGMDAAIAFNQLPPRAPPAALEAIERDTQALGFTLASTRATGLMLRALAASKPERRVLELGTGTGVATAWLLATG